MRLEPHNMKKKPHTNSYVSLLKGTAGTPALSTSGSIDNFACLQSVGNKLPQHQPLSSKASACLEFLKDRIRKQGKHAAKRSTQDLHKDVHRGELHSS